MYRRLRWQGPRVTSGLQLGFLNVNGVACVPERQVFPLPGWGWVELPSWSSIIGTTLGHSSISNVASRPEWNAYQRQAKCCQNLSDSPLNEASDKKQKNKIWRVTSSDSDALPYKIHYRTTHLMHNNSSYVQRIPPLRPAYLTQHPFYLAILQVQR